MRTRNLLFVMAISAIMLMLSVSGCSFCKAVMKEINETAQRNNAYRSTPASPCDERNYVGAGAGWVVIGGVAPDYIRLDQANTKFRVELAYEFPEYRITKVRYYYLGKKGSFEWGKTGTLNHPKQAMTGKLDVNIYGRRIISWIAQNGTRKQKLGQEIRITSFPVPIEALRHYTQ